MNMPRVKNEISIGTISSWAGLVMLIVGVGIAIGQDRTEIAALKAGQIQSNADSRALIKLQSDMDYLKDAVDELRTRR